MTASFHPPPGRMFFYVIGTARLGQLTDWNGGAPPIPAWRRIAFGSVVWHPRAL